MTAPPPDPPKSLLARHRVLAPTAAVHVSPICLGAMNFGNAWKSIMGECSKETAFEMLDYFYEQGGNFIDTSVTPLSIIEIVNSAKSALQGKWLPGRRIRDLAGRVDDQDWAKGRASHRDKIFCWI